VLAVAQAVAVDADEGRALLPVPALHAGPERVAARLVRLVEDRVRVADCAQEDLEDDEADDDARQHDGDADAQRRLGRLLGSAFRHGGGNSTQL
jgi:hypothetical protein